MQYPRCLVLALTLYLLLPFASVAQSAQTTFEFHNGIWLNLHHTLFYQAVGNKSGRPPDLSVLTPAETGVWNQALTFYSQSLANHDLLEASMVRMHQSLAVAGDTPGLRVPGLSPNMVQVLEAVAPIYRARFWPEHEARNREWIASVIPLVAKHETALKPALARAYDTPWPKSSIRVEVSYYVTGNSAYTSTEPTLITVSSRSERNQGAGGVETLFHEAGHALVQKTFAEIGKEEKSRKKTLKYRDLWHALMFYTTGELARKQLPELEPYAMIYGLWDANWPEIFTILEKEWKPFLEGKTTFKDAIKQVVAASPER
jgi:hypothetical protein